MLSRVIDRSQAHNVELFAWPRTLPHPGGRGNGQCGSHGASKTPEPAGSDSGADEGGAEMERRIREAYDRGIKEGQAAAKRAESDQFRALIERMGAAVTELAESHSQVLRDAEPGIVRLAIEIARRILHRELTVDPESIGGLIRAGMERLIADKIHRLRLHPDLEPAVRECIERAGQGRQFAVAADSSLQPGTLIFETDQGDLDASLETQLAEIERGLADRLKTR